MSLIMGKDGKVSAIRVGSISVVVGLIFVIGAGIAFYTDQMSRRQPLDIVPYSGAEYRGTGNQTPISQFLYYRVTGDIDFADEVAKYYNDQLADFSGNTQPDDCKRIPAVGYFASYVERTGVIPYYWRCMFDNSGFNNTQWTEIIIEPGIWDEDPDKNNEGFVTIRYEQHWSK